MPTHFRIRLFHFDADPYFISMSIQIWIRIRNLPQVLHILGNQKLVFAFIHRCASLHCYLFFVSIIGVKFSTFLYIILTFSGKKYGICN
jgi:hypothetical protein